MIKRFDLVRILTINRVKLVSGPAGRPAKPSGVWSVIAGSGKSDLLLAKEQTVIIIPSNDVVHIGSFDNSEVLKKINTKSIEDINKILEEHNKRDIKNG